MSEAAHNLTPAEITERKLWLQRLKADFPKPGAAIVPIRRAPLGLAPVPGDDDEPERDAGGKFDGARVSADCG